MFYHQLMIHHSCQLLKFIAVSVKISALGLSYISFDHTQFCLISICSSFQSALSFAFMLHSKQASSYSSLTPFLLQILHLSKYYLSAHFLQMRAFSFIPSNNINHTFSLFILISLSVLSRWAPS